MSLPESQPMTPEEIKQAEIEALEMERHAKLMELAAIDKRLAVYGIVHKKKRVVDISANTR